MLTTQENLGKEPLKRPLGSWKVHSVYLGGFISRGRREAWRVLSEPSTESWLYLACYREQEKQKDAIRWMIQHIHRNGHGLSLKNIHPVIRARKFLVNNKFLRERLNPKNHHMLKLRSEPEPFIPYAEMRLNTPHLRKGKLTFSTDERDVLLKILDSCWFRQSFEADLEMKELGGDGALRTLAEFAEEVFAIPAAMNRYGFEPSIELVLQSSTFDDFMVTWGKTNIEPYHKIRSTLATVAAQLRRIFPGSGLNCSSRTLLNTQASHLYASPRTSRKSVPRREYSVHFRQGFGRRIKGF